MERYLSSQLYQHVDEHIVVRGWLHNIRLLGKIGFLIIRDRSGLIQIVAKDPRELAKVSALSPGAILKVFGKVAVNERCDLGFELIEAKIEVEVAIDQPSPIEYWLPDLNAHQETQLNNRALAIRHKRSLAIFRIQASIADSIRRFMQQIGAIEYFGPSLVFGSSEGGSDTFSVDYFGQRVGLAQSNQLYKQMMVGAFERVFAIASFFRAENSHTSRHLTEGRQVEFEMGFFESWDEILLVQELLIKQLIEDLELSCKEQLRELQIDLPLAPREISFPRLTLKQAQQVVYEKTQTDERDQDDLSPFAERQLCFYAKETFKTDFLFVTDWSRDKRPFYSQPKSEDVNLTNTFDLLGMGGEISSGGQRRHLFESVVEGLKSKDLDPRDFEDYLLAFRFGLPPHGGFGMGLERLTMLLLKLPNIRDATPFPSDPKRVAAKKIKGRIVWGAEELRNEAINRYNAHKIPYTLLTDLKSIAGETCTIKCSIFLGTLSKKHYLLAVSHQANFDLEKIVSLVGEPVQKEPDLIIAKRYGIPADRLPPLGHLIDLTTLIDKDIALLENVIFPIGISGEWMQLTTQNLIESTQAQVSAISR